MKLLFMTLLTACGGDKIHPIDCQKTRQGLPTLCPIRMEMALLTPMMCPEDPLQWTDADGDGQCDELDACPDDPLQYTDVDGDGHCDEVADGVQTIPAVG